MGNQTEHLGVRMIPETKRKIEEKAKEGGFLSASDYVRYVIRRDLEREVQ